MGVLLVVFIIIIIICYGWLRFFEWDVVCLVFCLPSPCLLNNANVLALLETEEIT